MRSSRVARVRGAASDAAKVRDGPAEEEGSKGRAPLHSMMVQDESLLILAYMTHSCLRDTQHPLQSPLTMEMTVKERDGHTDASARCHVARHIPSPRSAAGHWIPSGAGPNSHCLTSGRGRRPDGGVPLILLAGICMDTSTAIRSYGGNSVA